MAPTTEDINRVLEVISEEDANREDEILQAIYDTLMFALGNNGTADAFIAMYVLEG